MTEQTSVPDELKELSLRAVGEPTAVLELAGVRLLTDPTFDPPGSYVPRPGVSLTKTAGPALAPDAIGPVDAVLLSHDQHKDNLDDAERVFLADVPQVLTTRSGAERLGGATALPNWETVEIGRPDGGNLLVTGVPAQHGPDGTEHLTGEVTGFVLSGDDLPTVYISGDNASLNVVRRIVERLGRVDVAILFVGGAQLPYLGDAYLTLASADAPEATRVLGARCVVPVHCHGWAHFSDSCESLRSAFERAGIRDRLALIAPGESIALTDCSGKL
jgi:L-ascorbate metabolism protein UlaG (beta-lactamase superfamily)